ncbi:hypothetical protein L484_022864 [Morus notabilis]|uniref:Uncharacterized protein n=1 Tax=Morus notabilis TaxID=981085 RepID=W9RVB8_9ROSA|nr:hypothetical protein L484_022864 [Morus notabilis]
MAITTIVCKAPSTCRHQRYGTITTAKRSSQFLVCQRDATMIYHHGKESSGIRRELSKQGRAIMDIRARVVDEQQRHFTRAQFEANYFNTLGLMFHRFSRSSGQDMMDIPPLSQHPESLIQPYNPYLLPQGDGGGVDQ